MFSQASVCSRGVSIFSSFLNGGGGGGSDQTPPSRADSRQHTLPQTRHPATQIRHPPPKTRYTRPPPPPPRWLLPRSVRILLECILVFSFFIRSFLLSFHSFHSFSCYFPSLLFFLYSFLFLPFQYYLFLLYISFFFLFWTLPRRLYGFFFDKLHPFF